MDPVAEIPKQHLTMTVEARSWAFALPLEDAIETMRPMAAATAAPAKGRR
ncbi:MAG: hypothetical protein IT372_07225 [Polyangiaceae bacterium]|nr:hypothetical protein [Polyangiaceae bacterium]